MKLKKQYIILIVLMLLIPTLICIFRKNEILISDIFNKNNKLAKYNFTQNNGCDQWIDITKIDDLDIISKNGNSLIIDASNTNLPDSSGKNKGYAGFAFIKENGCVENAENYLELYNKPNSCSAMKSFVLRKPYDGLNRYNYNYWVRLYNNICTHDKLTEKQEIECNDTTKNEIISANDINKAKKFNSLCPNELKIQLSTITIDFQGGWGPNTLGTNWNGSDGVYQIQGIVGQRHTVQFDKKLVYGVLKLIGWSNNQTCSTYTRINNDLEHPFIFANSNTTYYACYENDLISSTLFEDKDNDGILESKKNIEIKNATENKECSQNILKLTNSFYRETTNISHYVDKLTGDSTSPINPYCNVVCKDDVKVSYPSIFQTVPAGQYFEFMYEPEITATRTCTSEFNYVDWEKAYKTAVDAEIAAMNELNKAKANLEAANNLSCPSGTCTDYADTIKSDGSICRGCGSCEEWESSITKTNTYYHSEYRYQINADPQSAIGVSTTSASVAKTLCENDITTLIGNATSGLTKTLNEKINAYKDAVTKRIKLEQNNYQCYTILDQDNNTNPRAYSEVFNNNYEYNNALKVNETKYELKTQLVPTPPSNSSTSETYATYIGNGENGGITTTTLQQLNNSPIGKTVSFYAVYPKLIFKYDNGSNGKPYDFYTFENDILLVSEKTEETLMPEAHVKLDTGAFTSDDSGNYIKDATTINIGENRYFHVDGNKSNHITFKAYTATKTKRQVQYYFKYREPTEYYSKKHNGATTIIKPAGEAYISLTKKEELTKKDNSKTIVLNNVFPIELKAIEGNYYNGIILTNYQNMTSTNTDSNSYFDKSTFGDNFKGVYTCEHTVTNDALKLSGKKETFKDLKNNTIFRSVATDNIDPNDRALTGNLGENWINKKGEAVQTLIKSKETHDEVTKDTYNVKNLEYSFTLTPKIIGAIKTANSKTNYDDFNLICTEDGRECKSVFLTYLSDGKIINPESINFNSNGIINNLYSLTLIDTYNNYSSLNNWNSDDLDDVRNKWKYYIGESNITGCTKQSDTKLAICKQNIITLDIYNQLYEKWGVLP